jgi:DNA-binding transcriptional regulator YdaS (Cro superfamily)
MEHLIAWLNEERGRRKALAETLGMYPSALSQWSQVPADKALAVEAATGIPRYDLRPDVYGPAPRAVA